MKYIIICILIIVCNSSFSQNLKKDLSRKYTKWVIMYNPDVPTEISLFNNSDDVTYYSNDLKNVYNIENWYDEAWVLNKHYFAYRKVLDPTDSFRTKIYDYIFKLKIQKINGKSYMFFFNKDELIGIYEYIHTVKYFDEFSPEKKDMKIIKLKVISKIDFELFKKFLSKPTPYVRYVPKKII